MKGTEKQIAWAADLQAKTISGIEAARQQLEASRPGSCDLIINYIRNAEYASDIIEVFGGWNTYDVRRVLACIRITSKTNVYDKSGLEKVQALWKR